MAALNDKQAKMITEGKNFAHIATLKKDGSPQVTPIWVDYDGTYVIFNSEEKRATQRPRHPESCNDSDCGRRADADLAALDKYHGR